MKLERAVWGWGKEVLRAEEGRKEKTVGGWDSRLHTTPKQKEGTVGRGRGLTGGRPGAGRGKEKINGHEVCLKMPQ